LQVVLGGTRQKRKTSQAGEACWKENSHESGAPLH
jgi:hypothetical protein